MTAWAPCCSDSGWNCRSFRPAWAAAWLDTSSPRRSLRPVGLGTIGILAPDDLRREIVAARRLSDRPLAVNLLLPFARRGHFEAASEADVVVTFWGSPKRQTSKIWIHQCGSVEEALAAREAGADAVIAQGVEAGGHVRGTVPAMELLARVRGAVPDDYPVLSAGGIADASDVKARLDAGAEAVVCGTRFLMTEESGAHHLQARLVEPKGRPTELFGVGWPARAPRCSQPGHRSLAGARSARPWLAACISSRHLAASPVPRRCRSAWRQPKIEPPDVRPCRGDRRRAPEPDRGGTALRGGVRRPHQRHPFGRRARTRVGTLTRHQRDPLPANCRTRPRFVPRTGVPAASSIRPERQATQIPRRGDIPANQDALDAGR